MSRRGSISLLALSLLLAPTLAFGQQADDPWGDIRPETARPAAPPRAVAPTVTPARPAAPAAPRAAAPAAAAAPAPSSAAPAAAAAPPAAVAPRPQPPAQAVVIPPPLPRPRPAEAPAREAVAEAVPVASPAVSIADRDPAGPDDVAPEADAAAVTSRTDEAEATPRVAAPAIAPVVPSLAPTPGTAVATVPPLPGDSPIVAAAYGIMSVIAPITPAAAAVPPVAPDAQIGVSANPQSSARAPEAAAIVPDGAQRTDAPVASQAAPAAPAPAAPAVASAPAAVAVPAPVAAPAPAAPKPVAAAAAAPVAAAPAPAAPVTPSSSAQRAASVAQARAAAAPTVVAMAAPMPAASITGAPLGQVEPSPGSARAPLWPQDMVRALRRAQDSMAQGSTAALEAQRTLIARIEQEFAAADAATWQDPHNARAAVTYFLSGGNPAILRRMMDMQPPPAIDPRLLRGTLAYLEGREDESLRQLKDIDARSLPPSLGGQVALAQAALNVRKDPAKSAHLLAVARLLAPGTLVEEAALRRAILIASQLGDAASFEYLSKQYLFRFRNSVYAGNFRQRFAAALSRIGFGNGPDQFHRLDAMLDMLEPDSRREMELTVARAAVVQGRTTTANFAADRALAALPDGSDDAERAKLYRAASLAPNPDTYKEAIADLNSVDKMRLAPSDAALLEAATATAETVRRATDSPSAMTPRPQETAGPLSKADTLPVMERAREAIANVDAILKGTAR